MGEFRVHRCRFFDFQPSAIHCLAYSPQAKRLALSRSDGSVELWSVKDNWYQEKILPPHKGCSIEALLWCGSRLFSAGLHCQLHEHDPLTGQLKSSIHSNSGPIWCMALNQAQTHIAAGTEEGCVVIFEVTDSGAQYHRALDKAEGRILAVAWYEAEDLMVTGGVDNIRVWSCKSGHAIQRLTLGRQDRNKDTIVWAVAVTSDFTIVSGDSRGKTCFWNGRQGTLLKAFQSHKEAVLCLSLSLDGTTVHSSGVDPALVQFEYISANPDSDWKMWVRSGCRTQHTHDVRALTVVGDCLVSGGVDCQLVLNYLEVKPGSPKQWRRIPPVPQHPLVQCAQKVQTLLLQYPDSLELWKLGSTSSHSEKDGEVLSLKSNPAKLVQLKAREGEHLVCSAVSQCGRWLAYCDTQTLRLFSLTLEEGTQQPYPKVALGRVRNLPTTLLPSRCLQFTPDGALLVSVTTCGKVQLITVGEKDTEVKGTLEIPEGANTDSTVSKKGGVGVHLLTMCPSGRYFAVGDHGGNVHVFSLKTTKHVCGLPQYHSQPTALAFHPTQHKLLAVYADMKIFEYSIKAQEYTDWSRQQSATYHPAWLKRNSKVTRVAYHPTRTHQVVLSDEDMVCVIDQTQRLPGPQDPLVDSTNWSKKEKAKRTSDPHAYHICNKFKYLLHTELLEDDFLVVVEQPPMALVEALPPPLKHKQFGT